MHHNCSEYNDWRPWMPNMYFMKSGCIFTDALTVRYCILMPTQSLLEQCIRSPEQDQKLRHESQCCWYQLRYALISPLPPICSCPQLLVRSWLSSSYLCPFLLPAIALPALPAAPCLILSSGLAPQSNCGSSPCPQARGCRHRRAVPRTWGIQQ